jgi:hypothetical protein
VLDELRVGDLVLAASAGPSPRVPRGAWADVAVREGMLWRVTTPYRYDDTPVWPTPSKSPDERYPHRFGIEEVARITVIDRGTVGIEGMDALWYSANNRGVAMPPVSDAPLPVAGAAATEADDPAIRRVLDELDGSLDAPSVANYRREQSKLRATLFGKKIIDTCALCGRTVPLAFLRAAHIKQRSKCTAEERLQLDNIMRACTLGCDHLFELGYVYVDSAAKIRRRPGEQTTPDLEAVIARLEGRSCSAHTSDSERYFAWHRDNRLS